ncbi:MAG: WYL domain-containing protein [Bacteroidetes bacterium]|nr:WYL domain-containing protein [Bacteroidota bacterium]
MPSNKFAIIRYRIIDDLLTNKYKKYPGIDDIIAKCLEVMGIPVSKSTVEKDLNAMRFDEALGYRAPIAWHATEKGYYYTDPEYSIRSLPLQNDELEAIKFASDILSQLASTPLFRHYADIINTLALAGLDKATDEWPVIQFEHNPVASGTEWLEPLYRAIKERKQITLGYHSFDYESGVSLMVEPYLLKSYRLRWYLIARNVERKKVRIYGLDRIVRVDLTSQTFELPTDFRPADYFRYAFGISVLDDEPVEIEFQASPDLTPYLISQPLHHSQIQLPEKNNDWTTFRLKVWPTRELLMSLMGFGTDIRIVAPESIREAIRNSHEQAGKP